MLVAGGHRLVALFTSRGDDQVGELVDMSGHTFDSYFKKKVNR